MNERARKAQDCLKAAKLLYSRFLVNAYEDALPREACQTAGERVFRTGTGRSFLQNLYLKPPYQA